jgi:hypothetical protein
LVSDFEAASNDFLGRELSGDCHPEPFFETPTEYRLLEAFVTNPGKLLTHRWLLQRVWGAGYASENQYLRVFIRQLRQKLGDDPPGLDPSSPSPGSATAGGRTPTRIHRPLPRRSRRALHSEP